MTPKRTGTLLNSSQLPYLILSDPSTARPSALNSTKLNSTAVREPVSLLHETGFTSESWRGWELGFGKAVFGDFKHSPVTAGFRAGWTPFAYPIEGPADIDQIQDALKSHELRIIFHPELG